jgi:hypothetical protein
MSALRVCLFIQVGTAMIPDHDGKVRLSAHGEQVHLLFGLALTRLLRLVSSTGVILVWLWVEQMRRLVDGSNPCREAVNDVFVAHVIIFEAVYI